MLTAFYVTIVGVWSLTRFEGIGVKDIRPRLRIIEIVDRVHLLSLLVRYLHVNVFF